MKPAVMIYLSFGRGRAATLVSRAGEGARIELDASALTSARGASSPEGKGIRKLA
jgi:hypothetical protein